MPKILYLMRHAQSAEKQAGQSDKDRELTQEGVKEALLIANYMNGKKIFPQVVYTSTAMRSVMTTRLLSDALKFDDEKILKDDELYNASVRTFFEFVNNLDDVYTEVMCVGHNPVISYLAEYLTKAEIGDMKTGGIVSIKFNITRWKEVQQGNGELIEYIHPRMIIN